jgi:hypothetical protein
VGQPPGEDDGVACTEARCQEDPPGVLHVPVDAACEDGLFCNGAERCDAARGCVMGTAPAVDDGVLCTLDLCDEDNDRVLHVANDRACDDGLFCDGVEACDPARGCVMGTAPAVDDGVFCTVDACDEARDAVIHTPLGERCGSEERCDPQMGCVEAPECASDADCDDGRFCNGAESCGAERRCQSGAAPEVDDGVSCTADACDEASDRVIHTPREGFCDDGRFCNGIERCDPALDCQSGPAPEVDDGVSCTVDACDEANDRVTHAAQDGLCDDGLFCNGAERCDPVLDCQSGAAPEVEDGVSCTADACDEARDAVIHSPRDGSCDDGLFCNGIERCDPVLDCQVGAAPGVDDGVFCTVDACDEEADAVVHTPQGSRCGPEELCDPQMGCVEAPECASDADCDDGRFCNGAERCDPDGRCAAGTPPPRNDRVSCTRDACDEANDRVTHSPLDSFCDDGVFCNGAERCDVMRGCRAGVAPVVEDGVSCTLDACEEGLGAVVHTPRDAFCDDGRFCNGVERCDPALDCQAGAAPRVDDGVSCTLDACDEALDAVVHAPDDAACEDGDPCTVDRCGSSGCEGAALAVCAPDDACCPVGCGAVEDNDCASVCGDGVLEVGSEACEADADCPRGGRCADCACVEACEDGVDNDQDGALDCVDGDCAGDGACRLVIPLVGVRASREGAAAWRTTGSGFEPARQGHALPAPYNQCGDPSTYPFLGSADSAGPAPQYTPLDPQSPGGAHGVAPFEGTWRLSEVMARYRRGPGSLRLSFGRMDLGEDVEGEDWFFVGDVETRYYRGGLLWLTWDGEVILEAPMPMLALRIDYNEPQVCSDEAIEVESEVFTAAIFTDVSQGASAEAQEVAQALLSDLGLGGALRLYSLSLQPALQQEFNVQGRLGAFYELPRLLLESAP